MGTEKINKQLVDHEMDEVTSVLLYTLIKDTINPKEVHDIINIDEMSPISQEVIHVGGREDGPVVPYFYDRSIHISKFAEKTSGEILDALITRTLHRITGTEKYRKLFCLERLVRFQIALAKYVRAINEVLTNVEVSVDVGETEPVMIANTLADQVIPAGTIPNAFEPPETLIEARKKYPHYHKPVKGMTHMDSYRMHYLMNIDDPSGALQHASKKINFAGQRGGKERLKDIIEARDTLTIYIDMVAELKACGLWRGD